MTVLYQLRFNGGYYYIGITDDLNSRIKAHQEFWKRDGLKITSIKIIFFGSREQASKLERARIKESNDGYCLNKVYKEIDENPVYDDIVHPAQIFSSHRKGEDRRKWLRKQMDKLEKRYISLYLDLEKAKKNMDIIEEIVKEAVYGEIRK